MKPAQRAQAAEPFYAMAVSQRAAELEAAGHDVVKLSLGEPDFGAPQAVRDAMVTAMDGRPLPYTSAFGSTELRSAIAGFYHDRHGVQIDPARIAVTSGASAALLLATAATVDPGHDVILADPSYPCNRAMIETFGGRAIAVPTSAATRFQLDRAAVVGAWTDSVAAVMIATPSNPTGTSMPAAELEAVCALARERDVWRIVDEIYLDLADPTESGPARSVLTTDSDAIVIGSFSKYFGMTGWRLGWCVLPESLVPVVERLAQNYFICASAPAQVAALACFTDDTLAVCEARRLEFAARRRLVVDGLSLLSLPVSSEPDGAFYAYFDVSGTGLGSWEFCRRALEDAHVALTPGRDFGTHTAETHVRLSYAASREQLTEGLLRLGRLLESLRERRPA
ncbi:aminotransferase class I/II-fold pyridoxal phosphate-dependent enzyme [Tsukamurella sp. 8F]|nr:MULTISPECIES: aminotransferase class I/II-fold pyridoxal phosphate-dependent enzyme [unclassified Tsukamurella]MDF0529067.1 aminotransferase class I/II-fold pyridoxal phosphate-dependent enzyme [Tsukamurella sp. 8J]MDF0587441.1 aminotransferase class I/II-fold pyridoxal phosphate-dependent enzyme [Tsukamurella sp. 8F]